MGVFARLLFLPVYYNVVSLIYCCEGILILLCLAPIRLPFFVFFCLPFSASLLFLLFSASQLSFAVSGSSAEQALPRGPASLSGRVMYEWLALTSLQAQRHSNSVLPGSLFLVLSLCASPLFSYPLLITTLFSSSSFTVSSFVISTLFYYFPFSTSIFFIFSIIFHRSGSC